MSVLLYLSQIGGNFSKDYPVCTLENVLSSAVLERLHMQYIFAKNYSIISSLNGIENRVGRYNKVNFNFLALVSDTPSFQEWEKKIIHNDDILE